MIANNFHSRCIQAHYESARRQALAYLYATGAKALVIAEQKAYSADAFVGANEEAEVKQEIVNEERVKMVKRMLSEKQAIEVYKCARNGSVRLIKLKIKYHHKHAVLTWKSKHSLKKRFPIHNHTTVQLLTDKPTNSLVEFYNQAKAAPSYGNNTEQLILPYVRFQNSERTLDIRFKTIYEMEACLELIQLYPSEHWHSFTNEVTNESRDN